MDDKKRTYYGNALEGVGFDDSGRVVARFSNPKDWGDKECHVTESCLLEVAEDRIKFLQENIFPDDIAYRSIEHIELNENARFLVQQFKQKAGISLDTPPVDASKKYSVRDFDAAANDQEFAL